MISVSNSFSISTARLLTKPKRAAMFQLVAEDGTRLQWTTEPNDQAMLALDAWASNRDLFILGRAAELTDGVLALAGGAKVVYDGLPKGVKAIPGVYVD